MKRIIYIVLLSIYSVGVFSSTKTLSYTDSLETALCACREEIISCSSYMALFPESGLSFIQAFGYFESDTGETKYAPLYDGLDYIQTFFCGCDSQNADRYYYKILKLAIELEWQYDAVNFFQHELISRLSDSSSIFSQTMLRLVYRQSYEVRYKFWKFCLMGNVDQFTNDSFDERFEVIYSIINRNTRLSRPARKAYNDLCREFDKKINVRKTYDQPKK